MAISPRIRNDFSYELVRVIFLQSLSNLSTAFPTDVFELLVSINNVNNSVAFQPKSSIFFVKKKHHSNLLGWIAIREIVVIHKLTEKTPIDFSRLIIAFSPKYKRVRNPFTAAVS